MKYVKHTSSFGGRLKPRAISQLGSEKSYKSSEKTLTSSLLRNSFNQSWTATTPRTNLNTISSLFNSVKPPQPKVQYINIIGDAAFAPKYLSSTVKLEALRKEECNRNFEKTGPDTPRPDSPEVSAYFIIVKLGAKLKDALLFISAG